MTDGKTALKTESATDTKTTAKTADKSEDKTKIVAVLKADEMIGTGHLMRVKSILNYFKGCRLCLVSDSLSESLYPLCSEFYKITVTQKDLLSDAVLSLHPDLCIVDHYYLDSSFEAKIYPFTKVVVIDDLVNRKHQCHMLFDSWVLREPYEYKDLVNSDCILCVGHNYNYVKEAFSKLKHTVSKSGLPRVLVNFGGSDPAHACLNTAIAIKKGRLNLKYEFTILSGMSNPCHEQIKTLLDSMNNVTVLRHCTDMPALFSRTDLAIGAAGGMNSERNVAGIPSVVVEIADNQQGVCSFIKKYCLGECLTVDELKDPVAVNAKLQTLIANRSVYTQNCQKLYSKNGLANVVNSIKKLLILN